MSLSQVKRLIKGGYSISPEDIEKQYLTWVNIPEMLIFSHQRHHEKRRFIASLCPKRGNEKYAYNVKNRFNEFIVPFKKEKELQLEHQKKYGLYDGETHTSVLFVTLTYDTNLRGWREAWSRPHKPHHQSERTKQIELVTGIKKKYKTGIGEDWNRFLSNLKKLYGRVLVARCFESSEKGYPHIHAILYLEEQSFPTWLKWSEVEKKFIWRISYEEKLKMNSYYHSNIDVQGCPYLSDGLDYLAKYITKGADLNQKQTKTLALNWAYQKRSFSLGRIFKEEIFKRYLQLDLTPNIVIQTKCSSQRTLYEKDVKEPYYYEKKVEKSGVKLGSKYNLSMMQRISEEIYVCEGVLGRNRLKKLGGVPKNSWYFGLNDKQQVLAFKEFYKEEYEKSFIKDDLKNPFALLADLDIEARKKVCRGIVERSLRGCPVNDVEWWLNEGKYEKL